MKGKDLYFAYIGSDGTVGRIAKFVDGIQPFGYENGQWVSMNGLAKILFDATTDYKEISKDEAERLIKEK